MGCLGGSSGYAFDSWSQLRCCYLAHEFKPRVGFHPGGRRLLLKKCPSWPTNRLHLVIWKTLVKELTEGECVAGGQEKINLNSPQVLQSLNYIPKFLRASLYLSHLWRTLSSSLVNCYWTNEFIEAMAPPRACSEPRCPSRQPRSEGGYARWSSASRRRC